MAIVFVKGELTRDPYYKVGEKTPFAATSIKETYFVDGEERLGGYHEIVAFGEEAQRIGILRKGDTLDVKANLRYSPDKRYVSTRDESKNPFMAQLVVMSITSTTSADEDDDEDPFADA
ncbi:MAG: single-stranded DNA-binding protein [Actinobacteria bacterium]|nr:single-stranded DNA-binding protein [Actinomycetota bacterium]